MKRIIDSTSLLQIALVLLFWLAGFGLLRIVPLPFPAGLVGLALLLVALALRWLPLAHIQRGADLLLTRMLLFFVPAVLAVLDHREFLGVLGVKLLFVIVASTLAVMAVTVAVVQVVQRER